MHSRMHWKNVPTSRRDVIMELYLGFYRVISVLYINDVLSTHYHCEIIAALC